MDETMWTSIPASGIPKEETVWSRLPSREVIQDKLINSIPSREAVWSGINAVPGAVAATPACIVGAFGNCFSRARRMQFDQDQKRSLLSNLYHDDSRVNIRDAEVENATLELRRRIQKAEYEKHRRMEVDDDLKRHKQGGKKKTKDLAPNNQDGIDDDDSANNPVDDIPECTTVLKASDIRKMSVDELLNLDGSNNQTEATTASSLEGGRLRKWLAEIDGNKSMEYLSYATNFETQGFHSIKDLALLDEEDVDRALTEIGVNKFAHRARIRKAILRLSHVP
ncbi:hypothetical protein DYB32_006757 [Aphanomyces invadans]|uniref:SAM domain-containing protein n=1 Tax=Aphanomyces invadans TaxID=157072 RepID=A0A3R7A6E2_9STRA|nr:hypothetical protein DYB32_006757 [Aphanomyces invadans]